MEQRAKWGPPLFWAVVGALGLAAVYGRVALLHLTTGLVGGDLDGYENLWNNWWVKTALFDLHRSPFYTDYLYYPTGTSLRFHTLNPLNGLLTLPFNALFGPIATTNGLALVALALTTSAAFLLIRDWVGDPWAAFAGAALFTYGSRNVLVFYTLGQAEKLSAEWLPLYLFLLFRALPRPMDQSAPQPGPDRWRRYAGGAVGTLLLLSLTDWQYLMLAVFTTLLYCGYILLTPRPRAAKVAIFGRLALIGGSYTAVAGPILVWPMVQEALANPWLIVTGQSAAHALDLADLLGLGNPGYLALALAGLGAVRAWRWPAPAPILFWALAAGIFYLLALGPTLTVGGTATGLPLPYALLQRLPVFSIGRDPSRFEIIGRLGLSLLAAYGLAAVVGGQGSRVRGQGSGDGRQQHFSLFTFHFSLPQLRIQNSELRIPLCVLFLLISLGPFVAAAGQATVDSPQWPAFYRQIATDPADYALLELPLFTEKGRGEDHYQAYQVLHGKPRFGGRLARDHKLDNPANFVKHAGLFHQLFLLDAGAQAAHFYPDRDFLRRTDYATQGQAILNYYQVGYIVVYKEALDAAWDARAFGHIIGQILGPGAQPSYEDPLLRAYRVPAGPPAAQPLTLDTGDGWYESETREDGLTYRWANPTPSDPNAGAGAPPQPGELYTMNLTAGPLPATLRFTAFAFRQPRPLILTLDGAPVAQWELPGNETLTPLTGTFTLPPGNHRLAFSSPRPPLATGTPLDARRLSFALADLRLDTK